MLRTLTMMVLMTLGALILPRAGGAMAVGGGAGAAERVSLSPEQLRKAATHIVTGQVVGVYQRTETSGSWSYTRYLAEVRVKACEKGDGIKEGDLVCVRYWHRHWIGRGEVPTSGSGHRGLPSDADSVRIYLERIVTEGPDGRRTDTGFGVVEPNGFEKLAAEGGEKR